MDSLNEVLAILSEKEKEELKQFLTRKKSRRERKDTVLFDLINDGESKEVLKDNANAYHALRNRFMQKMIQFVALKRIDEDLSGTNKILSYSNFAEFLFERQQDKLGWKYLLKSEELAEKNQHYELLNMVLSLQLLYSEKESAPALKDIIIKKEKSKVLHQQEDTAVMAYALIKEKFAEMMITGEYLNFQMVVDNILSRFDMKQVTIERPKILYGVLEIVRNMMMSKKDFFSFEPFILSYYNQADFSINKRNHVYKLKILYMLSHVLYRNRKFNEAGKYLNILKEELVKYDGIYENQFKDKALLLDAAINCYSGQLDVAIGLLRKAIDDDELKDIDLIKANLNLTFYLALAGDFDAALSQMNNLNHSEKWYEKKMGREWVFKKNLMEVIIHYEMQNFEFTLSRLRSIQRNYGDMLRQDLYSRAKYFVNLIKQIVKKPERINDETFLEETNEKLTSIPEEQEDLQAMSFYAWYKSKVQKADTYSVLMDLVK